MDEFVICSLSPVCDHILQPMLLLLISESTPVTPSYSIGMYSFLFHLNRYALLSMFPFASIFVVLVLIVIILSYRCTNRPLFAKFL